MLYHFLLLLMSYCAVIKSSRKHSFLWFLTCLQVYSICIRILPYIYIYYFPFIFVINMEGMIFFVWLSGVVIREYAECPFTYWHLIPLSHAHQNRVEPGLTRSHGPLNPGSTQVSKVGSALITSRVEPRLRGVKVDYEV